MGFCARLRRHASTDPWLPVAPLARSTETRMAALGVSINCRGPPRHARFVRHESVACSCGESFWSSDSESDCRSQGTSCRALQSWYAAAAAESRKFESRWESSSVARSRCLPPPFCMRAIRTLVDCVLPLPAALSGRRPKNDLADEGRCKWWRTPSATGGGVGPCADLGAAGFWTGTVFIPTEAQGGGAGALGLEIGSTS
mmetsp:Transcript_59568/g.136641  ORF Transcript_59568/g.136641 Transcript_59568/m.136641 type:complete len:200 (+) Transcript_59568:1722-2321(+)